MSPIELGIGWGEMEKEARGKPLPDATYEFIVDHIDEQETAAGRPRWIWFLKVINHPQYNGRTVRYGTPLPWTDSSGQKDTSGIAFLFRMINGCGKQIMGTQLPDKEFFYGAGGFMKVKGVPDRNDPDTIYNEAAIVQPKKAQK
jgi:hypothetical protein